MTIRYTLYHAEPYLDIEWAIDGKTPNPIPEGGWICLPFAIEHPAFRLARLGSIIDPATDIIDGTPYGMQLELAFGSGSPRLFASASAARRVS